ncbi:hypothetical protein TrST_g10888 [Triparma strigata]|uniref:Uncharacterized protein n=1 Tax=Triparma strigata TaxID=1606541 RepID=A0A9W6ZPD3_9STRA|nr:hypothetical protein TrST_g10888 [Triparma strigata]
MLLLLGTNSFSPKPTNAIFTVEFDEKSHEFGALKKIEGDFGNPGWMTFSADGSLIVADESAPGRILTLKASTFEPLSAAVGVSDHPCHVVAHGKLVISTSYTGGTVNITNSVTGSTLLIDHSSMYADSWSSQQSSSSSSSSTIYQDRQESSHPHQTVVIEGETKTFLLVSDLGASTISTYDITALLLSSSAIATTPAPTLTPISTLMPSTGPTSGCRHSLNILEDVYTVNELNDTITHSKISLATGELTEVSTANLLAEDLITRAHHGGAGGICSNDDDNLVYVTVRHTSPGGVVAFKRDQSSGGLERVSVAESGGDVPRFIGNVGGGNIFICNQGSGGKVVKVGQDGVSLDVGEMVTWVGQRR